MKHFLFYVSTNQYERVNLTLAKSILVFDDGTGQGSANDHEVYYKDAFRVKEYSALHILVLNLDAANGVTEVLRNEYAENPLKKRIVINEQAKRPAVVRRKMGETVVPHFNADMFTTLEDA